MGIGDWFKRFKRNAAAIEHDRETAMGGDTGSQAARAAEERQPSPPADVPAADASRGSADGSDQA